MKKSNLETLKDIFIISTMARVFVPFKPSLFVDSNCENLDPEMTILTTPVWWNLKIPSKHLI